MASQHDLSSAFSRIRITKVNPKGFAFATNERNETVFVKPKFVKDIQAAGGSHQACLGDGEKGLFVKYLKTSSKTATVSDQDWGDWQIDQDQVALPNTEPGFKHFGVVLQCWRCGNELISGEDIYKINNGAVWTNTVSLSSIEASPESYQNKWKKTTAGVGVFTKVIHCIQCNQDIGTMFPEYVDDDTKRPEGPFPRFKITVCREQKGTGRYINQTVLKSKSRNEAEKLVQFLNPNNRPTIAARKNDAMTHYLQQAEEQAASLRVGSSSWRNKPSRYFSSGGGCVYIIDPQMIQDGVDCLEQTEFNFAAQQLIRLTGRPKTILTIEVYKSPPLETQWKKKRESIAERLNLSSVSQVETVWVFHGTSTHVMRDICETGFRVAQGDQIVNGAVHGNGVYTAIGPDTPMHYSQIQGSSACILSLALIGKRGDRKGTGIDCWKPRGDWLVFEDAAQLLPKYIIHYN